MGNGNSKPAIDPRYLKPQGLYACEWDDATVKKLILSRKLSPCYPGHETKQPNTDECPICMLVRICFMKKYFC